jgi:hypothetical protein
VVEPSAGAGIVIVAQFCFPCGLAVARLGKNQRVVPVILVGFEVLDDPRIDSACDLVARVLLSTL